MYQPAEPTPGYKFLTNLYNKDTPPPAVPGPPTNFNELAYQPDPMLTPSKIAQLPGTEPENQGSLARGITAGLQTTKEAYYAVKGLAQKALGDENGFRDSLSLAMLYDNSAGTLAPKYGIVDSVRYGTVGDMISSLGYALGTQVPTIATMTAATKNSLRPTFSANASSAGVFDFSRLLVRPLRTSCWMVGKLGP
jgi:hypothetical protein